MKKLFKVLLIILCIILLIFAGYFIYLMAGYERIEDNQPLEVSGAAANAGLVTAGKDSVYSITSWNIGFAAYTRDYSFFMDGGTKSRGESKEAVAANIDDIATRINSFNSDFCFVQEVDLDATRSYHIDQRQIILDKNPSKSYVTAINYDSGYLFYPFLEPHGKSLAGIMTLSSYDIASSVRRSLPIQEDLAKFIDLDRCYSVSRVAVDNGKELVLINLHLSAYTTDPTIADRQLDMLYDDMKSEYDKGNYVICGGDFNKDLLGDSSAIFGVSGEDYSWAKSFPLDTIPAGFSLVAPFDSTNPVPTCRNADQPWNPETDFQITIDGFIISDNVLLEYSKVIDTDFEYSDHNPVAMKFTLVK